jgi:hypothetical protein
VNFSALPAEEKERLLRLLRDVHEDLENERREKESLQKRVQEMEQARAREAETRNAERKALQAEIGALKERLRALEEGRGQQGDVEDPQALMEGLRREVSQLPLSQRSLVSELLEAAAKTQAGEKEWLEANLDAVDRCLYTPAETVGLLAHRGFRDTGLLHRIDLLRLWTHERLLEVGIEIIYPVPKRDRFDKDLHACPSRDFVFVHPESPLENSIHSVLRVGFRDTATGRVLRKAAVKRYVAGPEGAPSGGEEEDYLDLDEAAAPRESAR